MITSTFLGHQSWLLESADSTILVDPVLRDSFGTSEEMRFWIFPSRSISEVLLQRVTAVILTNEHLDHFDLPSLALLDRGTDVMLGPLAPEYMIEALHELGFQKVQRAGELDCTRIRDVEVTMTPPDSSEHVWESASHSAFVKDSVGDSVYVQGDRALPTGADALRYQPRTVIATNNSQIRCDDFSTVFANLLNPPTGNFTGLKIVRDVIATVGRTWQSVERIALSGNGYTLTQGRRQFLWTGPDQLNDALRVLALQTKIMALDPGQSISSDGSSSSPWVVLRSDSLDPNLPVPMGESRPYEIDFVIDQLNFFVPHIVSSEFGAALINANEHLGNLCGPERMYFGITRNGIQDEAIVYDLASSRFERSEIPVDDAVLTVPFGIIVDGGLLQSTLTGTAQVWEMGQFSNEQWYTGLDPSFSPLALLFGLLSSSVRPDLWRTSALNRAKTLSDAV